MKEYNIKSPTRIDLAGGLLDIWPVYALIQDCFVVNVSIPVFTSVELKLREDSQIAQFIRAVGDKEKINIEVLSPSGLYQKSFFNLNDILKEPADELSLLKKHLEYWRKSFKKKHLFQGSEGLSKFFKNAQKRDGVYSGEWNNKKKKEDESIYLKSESPVGGGLGGSSSLCVNLAKAFSAVFGKQLTQNELLIFCRDLETSLLGAPAGVQDYIPAMESKPDNLYIIECTPFGHQWKSKKIPAEFFKDHLLLVDTGKSHHSGSNNWEIVKKVIEKDQTLLSGINQLRDNALKTVDICERENWSDLFICLRKEQELREQFLFNWLTPSVSSVINLIIEWGAEGAKLCGAGGGGCLLVLAGNKKNKKNIENLCKKNDIPIVMNW